MTLIEKISSNQQFAIENINFLLRHRYKMKKMQYLVLNENMENIYKNVRIFLADSTRDYPRHDEWYKGVVQELKAGMNQKMIIVHDNRTIIGVSILKKNQFEKIPLFWQESR